ncbi:unnamed protein product [Bubo scandiacus]
MVQRSSLASRLPAQKAKPRGEVAQFPILENEEGSEAIYWNPPSPQPSPRPLLEVGGRKEEEGVEGGLGGMMLAVVII